MTYMKAWNLWNQFLSLSDFKALVKVPEDETTGNCFYFD